MLRVCVSSAGRYIGVTITMIKEGPISLRARAPTRTPTHTLPQWPAWYIR